MKKNNKNCEKIEIYSLRFGYYTNEEITLMEILTSDSQAYLFKNLSITSKRSMLCVNKNFYLFSSFMKQYETKFHKMINHDRYLSPIPNCYHYYPLYKYTVEMIYDDCTHMIPERYMIYQNIILTKYGSIYKILIKRNDTNTINIILSIIGNSASSLKIMIKYAVKYDNISLLEKIIHCKRMTIINSLLKIDEINIYAAKYGKNEIIEWYNLHRHSYKFGRSKSKQQLNDDALFEAIEKNQLKFIEKYLPLKNVTNDHIYYAAYYNHQNMLDYFQQTVFDEKKYYNMAIGALNGDHLDILKMAFGENNIPNFSTLIISDKTICGNIQIIRYLLDNNHMQIDLILAQTIVRSGNVQCLREIYKTETDPKLLNYLNDDCLYTMAFYYGHIEMLEYLLSLHKIDVSTIKIAVQDDAVTEINIYDIIKWIVDNKKNQWSPHYISNKDIVVILSKACEYNCLDAIKYIHNKIPQFPAQKIILYALHHNHINIMIWLLENFDNCDNYICAIAIYLERLDLVKWLRGIDRNIWQINTTITKIYPWVTVFSMHLQMSLYIY